MFQRDHIGVVFRGARTNHADERKSSSIFEVTVKSHSTVGVFACHLQTLYAPFANQLKAKRTTRSFERTVGGYIFVGGGVRQQSPINQYAKQAIA